MKISFDKFEQFEAPILTLCNPNSEVTIKDGKVTLSNTLGMLPDCKKVVLSPNFNTQWELSFEFSDSRNEQLHRMYKRLEKGRYIYVSDVGYFIIDDYARHESDEKVYKEISCHSVDKEIERNECPLLDEGSYYFYSKENDDGTITEGIIQKQMALLPKWTLGFVSDDLKDKTAYFDGENKSDNAYEFLWEEIEEAYECVIDVDFISRTLSFYSLEYYAAHHKTDIHLSKSNDLKEVVIESKDDDCFTAITVKQNDNLSLVYSNPNGSETLYNFTHCFSDMSSKLQAALIKWQEKYEATILPYRTLSEQWANALDDVTNAEKDLDILKEELNNLKRDRDTVINATASEETKQANLNVVNANISAKEQAISAQENIIATKKENIKTTYEEPLQAYANECSLSLTARDISGNLIFTQDLLNELSAYINPAEYSDDYITQTDDMKYAEIYQQSNKLFDRAKRELEKLSTQSYTFSVDNNSFLFNKKFERFSKQLIPGSIVYLETSDDTMEQVHLTNFSIDYDDCSVSFTFGNKYDENDLKSLFDDVFGSVKTSAVAVKYLKNIINDQRSELEKQKDWIDNALTLTKEHALTSNYQTVVIDDSGYWGRKLLLDKDGNVQYDTRGNPLYENEQLKITNNGVYLTTDNWGSFATAVGKIYLYHDEETGEDVFRYGVAGDLIVGKLFLGKQLTLLGNARSDGTYAITLNENGLTIINDGTTAGITIKDTNGNKQLYADEEGNLWLSGNINAIGGKIGGYVIDQHFLYNHTDSGSAGIGEYGYGHAFWAGTDNGDHSGNDAEFKVGHDGSLTSTKAKIGNWTIDHEKICSSGVIAERDGTYHSYETYMLSKPYTAENLIPHNPMFYVSYDNDVKFYVRSNGELLAKNANISGTITAEGGYIAGWEIHNDCFTKVVDIGGGSLRRVSMGSSLSNPAFGVTSNDWNSGVIFRVGWDGSLYAANANIRGTVNANNGYIGKWNIFSEFIQATNASNESSQLSSSGVWTNQQGDPEGASWHEIVFTCMGGSDEKLKQDIIDLNSSHDIFFDSLCPKEFKYNNKQYCGSINKTHFGFVYQNVINAKRKANFSNLAVDWNENGYGKINKMELIALNTWQIQKLKRRISALENRILELENQ